MINNTNILTTITNTSNNLINHDLYSSNICFNNSSNLTYMILNDNYCRKTTFYFTTSTLYNYNGINYYTYNIRLDKFIRFLSLDNGNITLAKFRIHTANYDSYFNDATIRESEYLIMLSNRNYNNATGGLNVRAIGIPQDTYLQKIEAWKVVKNSDYNYITYISPIQNAVILCTLIDEA